MEKLIALEDLNISGNRLRELPHGLLELTNHNLSILNVSCNKLKQFPDTDACQRVNKLKVFLFHQNEFLNVPSTLTHPYQNEAGSHLNNVLPTKITENVYLGCMQAALNKKGLKALGITHILNAANPVITYERVSLINSLIVIILILYTDIDTLRNSHTWCLVCATIALRIYCAKCRKRTDSWKRRSQKAAKS
jgi:hypothetical protein